MSLYRSAASPLMPIIAVASSRMVTIGGLATTAKLAAQAEAPRADTPPPTTHGHCRKFSRSLAHGSSCIVPAGCRTGIGAVVGGRCSASRAAFVLTGGAPWRGF